MITLTWNIFISSLEFEYILWTRPDANKQRKCRETLICSLLGAYCPHCLLESPKFPCSDQSITEDDRESFPISKSIAPQNSGLKKLETHEGPLLESVDARGILVLDNEYGVLPDNEDLAEDTLVKVWPKMPRSQCSDHWQVNVSDNFDLQLQNTLRVWPSPTHGYPQRGCIAAKCKS